jgi:hypothetical protein
MVPLYRQLRDCVGIFLIFITLFNFIGCCHPCSEAGGTQARPHSMLQAPSIPAPNQPNFIGMTESPISESMRINSAAQHRSKQQHGARPLDNPPPVPDPTVMSVDLALKSVMDQLNTLLTNATGDIKAAGASLEGNAQQLVGQIDARMGNELNKTISQLNAAERQMVQDAELLIAQMQAAAQALIAQTSDAAIVALREADILAYGAEADLPCQDRVPRVLYGISDSDVHPLFIRAGIDSPELRIRGNFLAYSVPSVTVDGQSAPVNYFNTDEVSINIPGAVLSGIQADHTSSVSFAPSSCRPRMLGNGKIQKGPVQSIGFLLKPQVNYTIQAYVSATADFPQTGLKWPIDYYNYADDCNASYDVDQTDCLPVQTPGPGAASELPTLVNTPTPWLIHTTTANCGSAVGIPKIQSNTCVTVPGHVQGCGTSWLVNCNGHGWLGYHIDLLYTGFVTSSLTEQQFTANPSQTQNSVEFVYNLPIPDGVQNIQWKYTVTIKRTEGAQVTSITLSESNQTDPSGPYSISFNPTVQKLVVSLPQTQ